MSFHDHDVPHPLTLNRPVESEGRSPWEGFDRRSRAGEPEFSDVAQAVGWRTGRRAAIHHVLALIAGSWWSDELVLRGSLPLQAWVGDRAREPADLDWVIVRNTREISTDWQYGNLIDLLRMWPALADQMEPGDISGTWDAERPSAVPEGMLESVLAAETTEECEPMYVDLLAQIKRRPEAAGGVILDADMTCVGSREGIWPYHGWGTCLEIPWLAPGLPPGRVRVEFAEEKVPRDLLEMALLPNDNGGPPVTVQTPSRELALAWKILWLKVESEEDGGARGKDLYDAVLLAEDEQTRLSPNVLKEVSSDLDLHIDTDFAPYQVREWSVAWEEFQAEYPWVQGSAQEWSDRLASALVSLFAASASADPHIQIGDSVTITSGPFSGVVATISEVNPKANKAKALARVFQRETLVEVSFDQIQN